MNVLSKPIDSITVDDLRQLITDGAPESDTLELKEALPAKDGIDPWHTGAERLSDRARNVILGEVIAFANAHGGTVLLGVEETDDHPKRAKAIRPIPRCADLAHRLQLMARDAIRPQLPVLEVSSIVTDDDGSGVIVLRTPESRLAPHRLEPTRECFIRRADRTEPMTMREIQDLVLLRNAGATQVEHLFNERRAGMRQRFGLGDDMAVAWATGIPTSRIWLDRVYLVAEVQPTFVPFMASFRAGLSQPLDFGLGRKGGHPYSAVHGSSPRTVTCRLMSIFISQD